MQFPFVTLLLLATGLVAGNPVKPNFIYLRIHELLSKRQSTPGPVNPFINRPANKTLQWFDCFPDQTPQQCARLQVPLDYSKPVAGDVFNISLVKVPADPSKPYKGTLFIFTPFEGGVDYVSTLGFIYRDYIYPGLGLDIIGIDGRGSGYTTPLLQCFPDSATSDAFATQARMMTGYGSFNGTFPPTQANIQANIASTTAFWQSFGQGCLKYYGKYLPYIGTVDNVRDLNNIIKLLGPKAGPKSLHLYGEASVLGETYAQLFPNDFDNMIIDGATNILNYNAFGDTGVSSLQDAEKALQVFFDSCAASTPCTWPASANDQTLGSCSGCYFWAPTAAGVKARYEAVKAKYYNKPFRSVPPNQFCGDCEVLYSWIGHQLGGGMSCPAGGLQFATINSLQLLEWEKGQAFNYGGNEYFARNFPATLTFQPYPIALRCMDRPFDLQGSLVLQADLVLLNATSSQTGKDTALKNVQCSSWLQTVSLKNPLPTILLPKVTKGKILFIANTADPVQPLNNAKAMSLLYPNSYVLPLNALGSTSFFSGSSYCVGSNEYNLLDKGVFPPKGTFCNDIGTDGPFGVPYQKNYS